MRCTIRPQYILLTLCTVQFVPNIFYLHYALYNSSPIYFTYIIHCAIRPQYILLTLCAVQFVPNIFYLHYALYNSSPIYFTYIMRCTIRPQYILLTLCAVQFVPILYLCCGLLLRNKWLQILRKLFFNSLFSYLTKKVAFSNLQGYKYIKFCV